MGFLHFDDAVAVIPDHLHCRASALDYPHSPRSGFYPAYLWLTLKHVKALIIFMKTMETKGFFQFEIIINVLFRSFRFILLPVMGLRPL